MAAELDNSQLTAAMDFVLPGAEFSGESGSVLFYH